MPLQSFEFDAFGFPLQVSRGAGGLVGPDGLVEVRSVVGFFMA